MTDARIIRTRAALHQAIIDLSSRKPLVEITVSELAELAGINRVTFYKHYDTPAETLAAALNARLVESLSEPGEHDSDRAALLQRTFGVLDHIDEYHTLYSLAYRDHIEGTIPVMLAQHFSEIFLTYLTQRRKKKPAIPDVDLDLAASFFASGITGSIHVWLTGGEMSRDRFTDNLDRLFPSWFFAEPTDD